MRKSQNGTGFFYSAQCALPIHAGLRGNYHTSCISGNYSCRKSDTNHTSFKPGFFVPFEPEFSLIRMLKQHSILQEKEERKQAFGNEALFGYVSWQSVESYLSIDCKRKTI